MTLQSIEIPDSVRKFPLTESAANLIDRANEQIEAFMLSDETVLDDFIPCDFHFFDQTLTWIRQDDLLEGNRFCELGSGFGVATMLAAIAGMNSVGIEIEPVLVEQSVRLANELGIDATFVSGSFGSLVPEGQMDSVSETQAAESQEIKIQRSAGIDWQDFDLFFAFPWPQERASLEKLFELSAAKGALMLTYRERAGMQLLRKP